MSVHPVLTLSVYIAASCVFAAVLLYWFLYTRNLKTPPGVGKNEGIAIATQQKERAGKTGSL